MDTEAVVIIVAGALVMVYQLFASVLVWRCKYFNARQRGAQLVLIWIVPVFGALVCHAVVQVHGEREAIRDSLVKHYDEADEYALRSPNRGGYSGG